MTPAPQEITVIINPDGSVFPFSDIFRPDNESEDELVGLIKDALEKKGRKLGVFYSEWKESP